MKSSPSALKAISKGFLKPAEISSKDDPSELNFVIHPPGAFMSFAWPLASKYGVNKLSSPQLVGIRLFCFTLSGIKVWLPAMK